MGLGQQVLKPAVFCIIQNNVYSFMSLRSLTVDITKAKSIQNELTSSQKSSKNVSRKKKRQFTDEEDSIILRRVKAMGYDNPET